MCYSGLEQLMFATANNHHFHSINKLIIKNPSPLKKIYVKKGIKCSKCGEHKLLGSDPNYCSSCGHMNSHSKGSNLEKIVKILCM